MVAVFMVIAKARWSWVNEWMRIILSSPNSAGGLHGIDFAAAGEMVNRIVDDDACASSFR